MRYLVLITLAVFKSLSTVERSVESCDINLDMEVCRLVFQLKCRHGITKTYHLTFQECESLQVKKNVWTGWIVTFTQTKLTVILKCLQSFVSFCSCHNPAIYFVAFC